MHTLVDICWTLYSSNTTYDFCRYVSGEKISPAPLSGWLRRANVAAYQLTGVDAYKAYLVGHLKGLSREQLQHYAADFVDDFLACRHVEPVWQLLPKNNLVLLSATLDIVAESIAQKIGAQKFYATHLDFNNEGLCCGTVSHDLQRKKHLVVDYEHFDIFTDNITDMPLIAKARRAVVVVYQNHDRWLTALQQNNVDASKITFVYATQRRY